MAVNLKQLPKTGSYKIMSIDPSGSHMAYTIGIVDTSSKSLNITHSGMIWTKASFNRGQRLRYMQACLNYIIDSYNIDHTITEAYFSNPKLLTGATAIIPVINCFIDMACSKFNKEFMELGPTSWRSILGIKKILVNGKSDYKKPTLDYVVKQLGSLPATLPSNLDMRERQFPHDASDSLAIALAIAKYNDITKVSLDKGCFRPVDLLSKLGELSKEL